MSLLTCVPAANHTGTPLGSLDNLLDGERSEVYSTADPFDTLSMASTSSAQSSTAAKMCVALYSYKVMVYI